MLLANFNILERENQLRLRLGWKYIFFNVKYFIGEVGLIQLHTIVLDHLRKSRKCFWSMLTFFSAKPIGT